MRYPAVTSLLGIVIASRAVVGLRQNGCLQAPNPDSRRPVQQVSMEEKLLMGYVHSSATRYEPNHLFERRLEMMFPVLDKTQPALGKYLRRYAVFAVALLVVAVVAICLLILRGLLHVLNF